MICMREAFPSQMKMTFRRQSQEVHKGKDTVNAPVERIEDHYRVSYFLPFIDHTISHINS
jgi:hypothetical protein